MADPLSVTIDSSSKNGSGVELVLHPPVEDGKVVSLFTESLVLKFRSKFYEFVEELRMRRETNEEDEKKLHELLSLKHKLEQDLEREQQKLSEILEEHADLETETQRKCSEQIRQLEEEKVKLSYSFEGKDKELQVLKDEIRVLHMSKYSLEKKLGEQEYSLQVMSSSRDTHHSQMSQMEQHCVDIEGKVTQITEQIDTLESNVKEAIDLNKDLQYVNNHQECQLSECRKELYRYRRECVKLKAKLSVGEISTDIKEHTSVNQQLKVEKEVVHQLQEQLSELRGEFCSVLQSLKEAHSLIDKHVEMANDASVHESALKDKVSELHERVDDLQQQLMTQNEESKKRMEDLESDSTHSNKKLCDITHRLKTLQEDYTRLQSSHDQLEEGKTLLQTTLATSDQTLEQTKEQLSLVKDELSGVSVKFVCVEKERNELILKLTQLQKEEEEKEEEEEKVSSFSSPDIISPALLPVKRVLMSQELETPSKRLRPNENTVAMETCSTITGSLLNYIMDIKSVDNDITIPTNDTDVIDSGAHTKTLIPQAQTGMELQESGNVQENISGTHSKTLIPRMQTGSELRESENVQQVNGIVFSDNEEEDLPDTQLCNQISKVQSFLLINRLKRGKTIKH